MTQQHTPGPWNYARHNDRFAPNYLVGKGQLTSPTAGYRVATVWGTVPGLSGPSVAEAAANARLIAAAPDLYDAASAWVTHMDAPGDGTDVTFEDEMRMMNALRSAVAKATGRAA